MSNSLKIVRERKRLSISQLAAKASIPAHVLIEYDEGRKAIPQTHLRMLAKALWATPEEIAAVPPPPPVPEKPPVREAPTPPMGETEGAATAEGPTAPPSVVGGVPLRPSSVTGSRARQEQPSRLPEGALPAPPKRRAPQPVPEAPITDGQMNELVRLGDILGLDGRALAERAGRPTADLTRIDARQLIGNLRREIAEAGLSIKGSKSIRESADFEPDFLAEKLRRQATLVFTMFDGQKFRGVISGFDPYTISIKDPTTGEETVLRKLAMMYYQVVDEGTA